MGYLYKNKRVLIAGGLGFIGSSLARRLVAAGAHVTLVDNLTPNCGGNRFNISGIETSVNWAQEDARDLKRMRALVSNSDFLFNLAGQSSHMGSMKEPFADLQANCEVALALLEACRLEQRKIPVVYASTRQIYGRPDYLPVDEKHPIHPVDVNGIHKYAAEQYHQIYSKVHDVPCVVLRLTNTIGPRMCIRDSRQTFLGVWIRCVLEGRSFEVWGGDQLRDFSYIDDTVEALYRVGLDGKSAGMIYNVGGCPPISLKDLAELVVSVHPRAGYVFKKYPAQHKMIDIGDYFADDRLLRRRLRWAPKTSLRAALKKALAYFQVHLEHYI